MTDRECHIQNLFTAELQFRLASAVRLAVTGSRQPLDLPMEWTHGQHRVRYEEVALRQDQGDYAASFLHTSTTYRMAVAIKDAIRAVVPDPKSSSDANVQAAYQIARLIRNAFAHAPFSPTWSIDPDCRDKTPARNVAPIPGRVILRQGDVILEKVDGIPPDAVPIDVKTRPDGGIDLGRGYVLYPTEKEEE